MSATIRVDEWQAELARVLQRARTRESGAVTMRELVQETGMGQKRITSGLYRLRSEGRLAVVAVPSTNLIGRATTVPGYKLLPKKKAARNA
jgi:hypothetical protein